MNQFPGMIGEYQMQAERIRQRIAELSAAITAAQKAGEGERAKKLAGRRIILYNEVWEMEDSIHTMERYLHQSRQRGE